MSKCETALNPLERDGTNRNQRLVAALEPTYAPVDERDVAELVLYARDLAEQLVFHPVSEAGAPQGDGVPDWFEFIDADISALVAQIGAVDVEQGRENFLDAATSIGLGPDAGQHLAGLLERIWVVADEIDGWYRKSIEGLKLRTRLGRFIDGSLAEAYKEAWAFALRLNELNVADVVPAHYPGRPWGEVAPAAADLSFIPSGDPQQDAADATNRIVRVFDRFHAVLTTLQAEAPGYLDETLENYPGHQPHFALFLAFLILLRHARDRINETTARHLRFYYEDVLRLDRKDAVPDQVHVVFELARDAQPQLLPASTELKAGKDAAGNDITFATDEELVVNAAEVDGLKTVFVDLDDGIVRNIYAAGQANSADGLGAEITRDDGNWDIFGSTSMPYATIGFAVAAPVLLLEQGSRTVTVRLRTRHGGNPLTEEERATAADELRDNLTASASGEKGWIPAVTDSVVVDNVAGGRRRITFTLEFAADADPVVAYDEETFGEGFETDQPLIKFDIDNDGLSAEGGIRLADRSKMDEFRDTTPKYERGAVVRHAGEAYRALATYEGVGFRPANHPNLWQHLQPSYAYRHLQGLIIEAVEIDVDVDGVTYLLLENDTSSIDPAKPFNPFGAVPRVGSNFLVGSREVFQKRVTSMKLDLTWAGLPQNFKDHYAGYVGSQKVGGNDHFEVDVEILDKGEWVDVESDVDLFASNSKGDLEDERTIPLSGTAIVPLIAEAPSGIDELDAYAPTLQRGYMRLRLVQDFLHPRYVASATGTAYTLVDETNVKLPDDTLAKLGANTVALVPSTTLPNVPYTPLLEAFAIDYAATQTIDLTKPARSDSPSTSTAAVFQIWPFGTRAISSGANERLLPEFDVSVRHADGTTGTTTAAGTLYVGLKNLEPAKKPNLSLLVEVAEGTADPDFTAPKVVWSYLAKDSWVDFAAGEVLADGTSDLTTSGVLSFAIPPAMTSANAVLPSGRHWIKASVERGAMAMVRAVALHTQAVTASLQDDDNDSNRGGESLRAETISKLVTRRAAIKSVTQPAASFGGRVAEADTEYFVRVSERLRHRNRAVTIFDYERIILETFPEVYKVRCINHTDAESEYAPGKVRLVVIPDLRSKSAVDPLRPRVSVGTLGRIGRHIRDLATDFADIEVTNPDYEEVRARFSVRFKDGYDIGYYTNQINEDIIELLSPWRHGDSTDLTFGGRIHRSWILDAIEDFGYVDFVADFEIDHVIDPETADTLTDVEEAKATRSSTVLVSARNHQVEHDLESCHDEVTAEAPSTAPPPGPSGLYDDPGLRFLGNTSSRELHDRWNLTVGCQIDEIDIDRRYFFASVDDSEPFGYDLCAYCSGQLPSDLLTGAPTELIESPTRITPGQPPDPRPDPAPGLRYLGNPISRELHDRWNLTTRCQVDEIAVDRRYYFAAIEDSASSGYDLCAFCFGKDRSKR